MNLHVLAHQPEGWTSWVLICPQLYRSHCFVARNVMDGLQKIAQCSQNYVTISKMTGSDIRDFFYSKLPFDKCDGFEFTIEV